MSAYKQICKNHTKSCNHINPQESVLIVISNSVKFTIFVQFFFLREIMRSLKVPTHDILGAQLLSLYEKSTFAQSPMAKGQS